ncbi:hypothetical protein B0A49_10811, partial [Cryomyces minteri]
GQPSGNRWSWHNPWEASKTSSSIAAPTATLKVSTDGNCGGSTGQTCQGSRWGDCCSQYGYCGASSLYCLNSLGCNSAFGSCADSATTLLKSFTKSSRPATPSTALTVSPDGSCGGDTENTCQGSAFGNCCSQYGWCGTSSAHCDAGCLSTFGTCK